MNSLQYTSFLVLAAWVTVLQFTAVHASQGHSFSCLAAGYMYGACGNQPGKRGEVFNAVEAEHLSSNYSCIGHPELEALCCQFDYKLPKPQNCIGPSTHDMFECWGEWDHGVCGRIVKAATLKVNNAISAALISKEFTCDSYGKARSSCCESHVDTVHNRAYNCIAVPSTPTIIHF
ncbi:hypothetical protein CROQUDRAFT_723108 [Cronartium quercuum f. sp. fusiforme G11]|uniref:Uncharacterized protein n=1 Tax=Cronartium quercuum f. sp. fusiforme G11 TaxID=708437 RepID=A0A9P6NHC5_9BASI|nr:hypothetical protein CROQUDRAFT_723108 [Cronartium quercuum f. sp. fusiforme G11]